MGIRALLTAGIALIIIIIALGWSSDHWYNKSVMWRDTARQYQLLTKQQADTITTMQQRQQILAALDQKYTEALNAAESENDALRRQLAAGTRRMYVRGKCPVSGTGTKTDPGSVGDATTIELAVGAGQNILAIRAGIISDQQKLSYLQEYIRQECMK